MNRTSVNHVRDVSARVSKWLLRAYPAYPGTVAPSADDPFVLCVRVFAVPADMAGQVQDAILDLQDLREYFKSVKDRKNQIRERRNKLEAPPKATMA